MFYIPWKTGILSSLSQAKANKTSFNSSVVYWMDMDLIFNWSIFYGKYRFWGLYYKQKHIKHHLTPVQYMELIWIWSVIELYCMENIDSEVYIQAKADKISFNSSTVYGMDMDLICNWTIFYGKQRFWRLYYKQKQIKHHSTPVQYMELIWIWSVIALFLWKT